MGIEATETPKPQVEIEEGAMSFDQGPDDGFSFSDRKKEPSLQIERQFIKEQKLA